MPVPGTRADANRATVAQICLASPLLVQVLDRWEAINLPDCWLVAGAVAGTIWNNAHGFAADHGIKDLDIVYHRAEDLSDQLEQEESLRLRTVFSDLNFDLDVKNEARVHLWYGPKFGQPIPPYPSTAAAIATFPATATAIGIRPDGRGGLEICDPFGLVDLIDLIVRPNKVQCTQAVYDAKCTRWQANWPKLKITPWDRACGRPEIG